MISDAELLLYVPAEGITAKAIALKLGESEREVTRVLRRLFNAGKLTSMHRSDLDIRLWYPAHG